MSDVLRIGVYCMHEKGKPEMLRSEVPCGVYLVVVEMDMKGEGWRHQLMEGTLDVCCHKTFVGVQGCSFSDLIEPIH